jgi:hypothetical protein
MAHQIDELPKTTRGREKKYDYTKYYDGKTWVIVQGEDFDCEVQSIRQMIYREVAETLNKSVKSTATEVNGKEALAFKVIDEAPKKRPRKDKTENGKAEGKAEAKQAPAKAAA